jgi:TDG/mug DNA glycosylase family protein
MILPDLLRPDLRLVICGTAAGNASAAARSYYAGPGNKFWRVLHEVGLTPRLLAPSEYAELLSFNIGLTDLAKKVSGNDAVLKGRDFDSISLRTLIADIRPKAFAFNGKKAASVFFSAPSALLKYGRQTDCIADTVLYVLPSTSGAASGHWSIEPWKRLAAEL